MENQFEPEARKIMKSFCVVGLKKNHIRKYSNEDIDKSYVKEVDIVCRIIEGNVDVIKIEGEKWTRIIKSRNYWLRVRYATKYNKPITGFTIVECEYESPEYLLIPKKYIDQGYKPSKIIQMQSNEEGEECCIPSEYNDYYMKVPICFNIKDELMLDHIDESQGAVLLVSKSTNELPLKDIKIIQCERNAKQGNITTAYKFGIVKCKHPYSFHYMPEVLDTYPIDNTINPGVAMFCFPEGISIKTTQDFPQWFSFILTDENGQYTYGSVLIFMEELTPDYYASFTPIYASSSNVYYYQKAICLLSNYPFISNSRVFLRELYRIQVSSYSLFPLERAICHFIDSLYYPSIDKAISFSFAENDFKFFHIPFYGDYRDTNDDNMQLLFQLISIENILTIWEGVLLERRVFLLCRSRLALIDVTMAILSLMYPFKWMHVIVPVLPEKLKIFIESPIPLIIGISFDISIEEFPTDALVFNIDKGQFENYIDKMPKLPSKLYMKMMKQFDRITKRKGYNEPMKDSIKRREMIMGLDDVFPSNDSEEVKHVSQLKNCELDIEEIRDIFYEFFIMMFKNYEKYFNWKGKGNKSEGVIFQKEVFLNDHSSNSIGSFLHLFTETTLFAQFEDSFKYSDTNINTSFFLDCIKKGKPKSISKAFIKSKQSRHYLSMTIPSITLVIPEISTKDLDNKKYSYPNNFPQLNHSLYIKTEAPHISLQSRFSYSHDEWCYDLDKLSNRDWGKYLLYAIHEIWFILLTQSITYYNDSKANILMDYATFLMEDLIYKRRIFPSKSLLRKIIQSCGRSSLNCYMKPLLNLINTTKQESNMIFHNAFMNGLYSITEAIVNQSNFNEPSTGDYSHNHLRDSRNKMYKTIFLTADLCSKCMKRTKTIKKINIEDILAGFSRNKNDYSTQCPYCFNSLFPRIYFMHEDQTTLSPDYVTFLSPLILLKEVDNIIMNKGEKYFYETAYTTDTNHSHINYNLMLYFKIFGLPLGILFINHDDEMFGEFVNEMNHSREIRQVPKKLSSKINISAENKQKRNSSQSLKLSQCNRSTSGKGSVASSNCSSSCKSMIDYFSSLGKYEKELWGGLVRNSTGKERNDYCGRETYDKDGKSLIDKARIKSRFSDIKTIIAYDVDYYVQNEKIRLEKLLFLIEYQQEIEGRNVFKTMNNEDDDKENRINEANCEDDSSVIESYRKTIIKNEISTTTLSSSSFFALPDDKKRSVNYKLVIKSSKSITSSSLLSIIPSTPKA